MLSRRAGKIAADDRRGFRVECDDGHGCVEPESPDDFHPSHLRQRINVAMRKQMDGINPFVQPGERVAGTEHAALARWRNAADPDSFRRREPA
jgi:hypothetical protein